MNCVNLLHGFNKDVFMLCICSFSTVSLCMMHICNLHQPAASHKLFANLYDTTVVLTQLENVKDYFKIVKKQTFSHSHTPKYQPKATAHKRAAIHSDHAKCSTSFK